MLKPSTHHVTTAGNKAALLRGLNSFIYLVIPEGLAATRLYAALLRGQTFDLLTERLETKQPSCEG